MHSAHMSMHSPEIVRKICREDKRACAGAHPQPGRHSEGLVVGCVVVLVLLVKLHIRDHEGRHNIQPLVGLQLLIRAAEQPCERPWLPGSLEAAQGHTIWSKSNSCIALQAKLS